MADQPELVIADGANRILVRLLARSHPHCDDYWDGNWIDTEVEIAAGAFRGAFAASLRSEELAAFRSGVSRLNETIQGTARLSTLEGQLEVTLTGDGQGHVSVAGRAQDEAGTGNVLQFSFEIDQTYLGPIAFVLNEMLTHFPPIPRPDA